MTGQTRNAGDLHSDERAMRSVGGFIVSEGRYRPCMRIARHDHERASLCQLLTGGYEERFGRRSRRCAPGMVIVHPEGEHHDEVHDPVCTKLLTIEVEAAHVRDLRLRAFDEAWHRTDYSVTALAYRLRADIARDDGASALAMESSILEMLGALEAGRIAATDGAPWLCVVRDYLDSAFQRPPSMRRLSEIAGVHPVYLARAFRRRFGCSVGAYVRRLQVGRAATLLEDPAHALSAVAQDAGFADQSHMTRRVLAETGLTPGAWRRRAA